MDEMAANGEGRARLRAVVISLAVSVVLLAAKYHAYRLTGSTAILSDALESIVNVVAAVFAIGRVIFAGRPADRNHPYGHGKIEFFSAAFEGGLIAFAALAHPLRGRPEPHPRRRAPLARPRARHRRAAGLVNLRSATIWSAPAAATTRWP